MSTPRADIPYHFITGLPPEAQRQLEINFLKIGQFIDSAPGPFITVASDGSGDYTSLQAAVTAATTAMSAGVAYATATIVIKAIGHSDTDAVINAVVGTGGNPDDRLFIMGPMRIAGITGSGNITFQNANIQMSSGAVTAFTNGFSGTVTFDNTTFTNSGVLGFAATACAFRILNGSYVDVLVGTAGGVVAAGIVADSRIVTVSQNNNYVDVRFSNCTIDQLSASSITITGSGTSSRLVFTDCIVGTAVGTTVTFAHFAANNVETVAFVDCLFTGSGHLAFNGHLDRNLVILDNCRGVPITTITTVGTGHESVSITGCAGSQLTLSGSFGRVYISGTFTQITNSVPDAVLNVVIDGTIGTGATLLTLTASGNLVTMAVTPGTTTTGVNVSGNNNIIYAANIAACATPSVDSGTGNHINAFSGPGSDTTAIHTGDSAGPWMAGTFPSPRPGPDWELQFQRPVPDGNASKINHKAISATPPTDAQVLTWNDTTKRWTPATPSAGAETDPLSQHLNDFTHDFLFL